MLDFASKVITYFKADTSEMEAGLKKLTGLEKEQQRAQLDSAKARNAGYDEWVGRLANVNQALELAGKAVGFAKDAFNSYAEDLKLRSAAGSVSIDKLKAASLGLRTEHELLTFAAKAQHGVYKLTEQQMGTAQRAMVALTRAGFDQEEVTNKITQALIKGKAEGLDDFGISVESTGSKVGDFNALMGALADKASGVQNGVRDAGEDAKAMGVSFHDSFDKIKQSIGELVVAMGPLVNMVAKVVGFAADAVGLVFKIPGNVVGGLTGEAYKNSSGSAKWDAFNKKDNRDTFGKPLNFYNPYASGQINPFSADYNPLSYQDYNPWEQGSEPDAGRIQEGTFYTFVNGKLKKILPPAGGGKKGPSKFSDYATVTGTDTDVAGRQIGFGSTYYGALGQAAAPPDLAGLDPQKILQDMLDLQKSIADARTKSALESIFGPIEEFDAYKEAFSTMGEVWGGFSNAVGASYEAIVTGQGSVSAAFKKIFADSLMATGKASAVDALRETALGLASLALGPIGGVSASMHFAAAGAHAAVATAAGVAAHALGAGSGSSATAAGASSGSRPQSGSGSTGASGGGNNAPADTRPIVVIAGSSFDDATPRQKQRYAEDALDRAMRLRDEA